uniref:Uncharacterized protein n=1 Tax=Anopheles coluzzii TaxID=1518534 RepID=A0A8W7PZQ2_ANOCL
MVMQQKANSSEDLRLKNPKIQPENEKGNTLIASRKPETRFIPFLITSTRKSTGSMSGLSFGLSSFSTSGFSAASSESEASVVACSFSAAVLASSQHTTESRHTSSAIRYREVQNPIRIQSTRNPLCAAGVRVGLAVRK